MSLSEVEMAWLRKARDADRGVDSPDDHATPEYQAFHRLVERGLLQRMSGT